MISTLNDGLAGLEQEPSFLPFFKSYIETFLVKFGVVINQTNILEYTLDSFLQSSLN